MEMPFEIFEAGFKAGEQNMKHRVLGNVLDVPCALTNAYEAWLEYQKSHPRLEIAEPGAKRPEASAEGSP